MITQKNYFEQVNRTSFNELPLPLKKAHISITVKTDKGKDWSLYSKDEAFKEMVDLAFKKLEEFISKKPDLSGTEKNQELSGKQKKEKHEKDYSDLYHEINFIQRFLGFHDKILYKNTFKIFIKELQTAIKDELITKESAAANLFMEMQVACINTYNEMDTAIHFKLKEITIKKLKDIIVKYENAKGKNDPPSEPEKFDKVDLQGLDAPVENPSITTQPEAVLCSTELSAMSFPTIGFKDKWLQLIGDPSPGFTAMVYGKPKMGKSYLCVDFAAYLARNHGKVLYVAAEEKTEATLQKKFTDLQAEHPNLYVSGNLPQDLSAYNFIFLDSVNNLALSPEDLKNLKNKNPGKSFVFIFQSTKEGNFRGTNTFQHDVDIVIEIPELGKAIQFGRFNQGGELQFFNQENSPKTLEEINSSNKFPIRGQKS